MTTKDSNVVTNTETATKETNDSRDRLILALDLPNVRRARQLIAQLGDIISFYKIGLQLQFAAGGIELARELKAAGQKIFFDTKLYDIGATVEKATRNIAQLGVDYLTVHAMSNSVSAAVKAASGSGLKILGVTILTSHGSEDFDEFGANYNIAELVKKRARRAVDQGADGLICSGQELAMLRAEYPEPFLLISPGIRPDGADLHDQKRVTTPQKAFHSGASHIVVGRPIVKAADPCEAAQQIFAQIS